MAKELICKVLQLHKEQEAVHDRRDYAGCPMSPLPMSMSDILTKNLRSRLLHK